MLAHVTQTCLCTRARLVRGWVWDITTGIVMLSHVSIITLHRNNNRVIASFSTKFFKFEHFHSINQNTHQTPIAMIPVLYFRSGPMEWPVGSFSLEGEFLIPEWTRSLFPSFWRVDTGWTSQTMLHALRTCKEHVCGKWNIISPPPHTYTHAHTHTDRHTSTHCLSIYWGKRERAPHQWVEWRNFSYIYIYVCILCVRPVYTYARCMRTLCAWFNWEHVNMLL